MKRSKKIIVAILGVILCVMLMCTPSFSWFTRESQTGGYFKWSNNGSADTLSYNTSNGKNITMKTYSSADGNTYGDTEVTSFSESSGVSAGGRKYYRTDISNSGATAQSVSLYLSNLKTSNTGDFYLGVNGPLKTYKNYSNAENSGTLSQTNLMRVYLQPNSVWTGGNNYYVFYKVGEKTTNIEMTYAKKDSIGGNTYYADIPVTTESYFFSDYNGDGGGGSYPTVTYETNTDGLSQYKSYVYKLNGSTDGTKKKTDKYEVTGANIINYYSFVKLKENSSFSIGLTKKEDYTGKSIEYSSSNDNVCTVDSNGNLTAKSNGTAIITITVKGDYDDVHTVSCVVNVGAENTETPIITNLNIPAKSGDKDSVVSVYWYIKNDTESGTLTYTIDNLYLSL